MHTTTVVYSDLRDEIGKIEADDWMYRLPAYDIN